jgi:hypothetical protein
MYWEESPDQIIGNEADENRDRERYCSKGKRYSPLDTVEACSRQRATPKGDDEDLSDYGDKVDGDEIPVLVQTFKHIESIIETAVALPDISFCQ